MPNSLNMKAFEKFSAGDLRLIGRMLFLKNISPLIYHFAALYKDKIQGKMHDICDTSFFEKPTLFTGVKPLIKNHLIDLFSDVVKSE